MTVWLVAIAGLADYLTFTGMVGKYGIGPELNPFVVYLYGVGGLPFLALLKASSVLLYVVAVLMLRPYYPRASTAMAVFGIMLGFVGAVSNTDWV